MKFSAKKNSFSPKLINYYRNTWTKESVKGMINWYRGMKFGADKKLPSIKVQPPVLILWGMKDKFIGVESVKPSLKLCEKGRASIFKNNTHWLVHEEPDRVSGKIFSFLKDNF